MGVLPSPPALLSLKVNFWAAASLLAAAPLSTAVPTLPQSDSGPVSACKQVSAPSFAAWFEKFSCKAAHAWLGMHRKSPTASQALWTRTSLWNCPCKAAQNAGGHTRKSPHEEAPVSTASATTTREPAESTAADSFAADASASSHGLEELCVKSALDCLDDLDGEEDSVLASKGSGQHRPRTSSE